MFCESAALVATTEKPHNFTLSLFWPLKELLLVRHQVPSPTASPGRRSPSRAKKPFFSDDGLATGSRVESAASVADGIAVEIGLDGAHRDVLKPFEPVALDEVRCSYPIASGGTRVACFVLSLKLSRSCCRTTIFMNLRGSQRPASPLRGTFTLFLLPIVLRSGRPQPLHDRQT